jgi:hypothetical protein
MGMPSAGEPDAMPEATAETAGSGAVRRMPIRIARAANDNHRLHAPWRRLVAASMAALFAASLILVGLVCIANAGVPLPPVTASN